MVRREKDHAVSRQACLIGSLKNELLFKHWREDQYSLGEEAIRETVEQISVISAVHKGCMNKHAGLLRENASDRCQMGLTWREYPCILNINYFYW